MVAEQTTSITEELEIMKKDTKDVHNNLADILTTLIGKIVKIEKALVTQKAKRKVKKNTEAHKSKPVKTTNIQPKCRR